MKLGNQQYLGVNLKREKDGLLGKLVEADGRITEVKEVKNLKTVCRGLMNELVNVQRRNEDLENQLE